MRICVYCGSSSGTSPAYAAAARLFGRTLAEQGHQLVYGGSHVGLMAEVADATMSAGGVAVGVIPRHLVDREIAHRGLSELHVVESMHERKALMAELADAFVALPGGVGTLDELFDTWIGLLLGLHGKPVGLLDVDGFYAPLLRAIDACVDAGFLTREAADTLVVERDPAALLAAFAAHQPPVAKWSGGVLPLDVLAWVVVRDGRVLSVRSREHDAYYAPGGKREPGESDAAALCREIQEELGVELDPLTLSLVTVVTAPAHGEPAGRLVRMICYTADPLPGSPEPKPQGEITDLRWLSLPERSLAAPADQVLMDQLAARGLL